MRQEPETIDGPGDEELTPRRPEEDETMAMGSMDNKSSADQKLVRTRARAKARLVVELALGKMPSRTTGEVLRGPIGKLREVARRCRSGEPLPEELAHWLAGAIQGFLDRRHSSLHDAFIPRYGKGGVPWWREEAIRRRDGVLRELAKKFFAGMRPAVQARRIRTLSVRYAACARHGDRERQDVPAHYRETVKEYLWRAFRTGATMPLGERQLRKILMP